MTAANKQLKKQGCAHATGAALQLIYAKGIALRFCLQEVKVFQWLTAQHIESEEALGYVLHLPLARATRLVEAVLWDRSLKEAGL